MIVYNSVVILQQVPLVSEGSHEASLIDLTCDKQQLFHDGDANNMLAPPDSSTPPPAKSDQTSSNGTWYVRNETAKKDPREMRKVILPESRVGLSYVQSLAQSSQRRKGNDITGKRRERKSVLPSETWKDIKNQLDDADIQIESREGAAVEGRIKATLTYYGTSAVFYNHQCKTKIRMRIRYYLSYSRDENGTINNVQREGDTKDKGYLELKVKSPRAYDENSVDKYRVLVSDGTIAELVNLNPTEHSFVDSLNDVKEAIQQEDTGNKSLMIDAMFQVMKKLAMRKPSFIRPSLVISYERSAFKYIEHDYPIPSSPTKKRNLLEAQSSTRRGMKLSRLAFALQWRKRRGHANVLDKLEKSSTETGSETTDGRETELQSLAQDDGRETDASSKHSFELHDIEYQFTIDRYVRAHYPLLPLKGEKRMPIAEHFDVTENTELMRYPSEARVVEFKEPLAVATLPKKDRSPTHNTLIKVLVERMHAEILFGDYDENVGKYGNFRRRLMEEHHTNRLKNEQIEIDFSGKAEYDGK